MNDGKQKKKFTLFFTSNDDKCCSGQLACNINPGRTVKIGLELIIISCVVPYLKT